MARQFLLGAAIFLAMPIPAIAQDMTSVCYSRGSEAEGVTGFTHVADGRAVRVDSPRASDSRTRVVEWVDEGFATEFLDRLTPVWEEIPTDLIAQCDEGWRDTIVVRFDDGSMDMREGSCIRNPVAQALDAIFAEISSLAESRTETFTEGAIDGVHNPCFHDW
ncbi:hypothetical protein [Hasllibacter sp. MH4015]|uniref:hypothetical protein n=1 Tax=Hasllibacter sp. MH4015 TaxID=2854029 RepID=UPI001CD4F23F|nr:hypothetical protein [Hasllibacter sp. MH4015]